MFVRFLGLLAVLMVLGIGAAAIVADEKGWGTDKVDESWATRALANSEDDQGWSQPCDDDWSEGGETHCDVREFPYAPKDVIAIRGGNNGGMTVMGWNKSATRVIYRIKGRASTEAKAKELVDAVRLEVVNGWLRPTGPDQSGRNTWSVEMKVWVPRSSDLALRTVNGPVAVRQVKGTMEIRTQNGPVSLVDLAGAVSAYTQNGPLHVELSGSKWIGAGLEAKATNGPVHLVLPKGYSARLETGTFNGPTDIDYPLQTADGQYRGRFATTLGSGGPPVRVVTDNGPFSLTER